MKIVYATDAYYPRTHGVAVCIDSGAKYLAELGHEVHIITPEYSKKDERKLHKNITVHRYSSYNLFFTTNKDERFIHFSNVKKIKKLLDKLEPDVIHVHLEFVIGVTVRKWAIKNNKPLVITAYTYYPPYIKLYAPYLTKKICFNLVKKFSKWFYEPADKLIVLTKELKDILIDTFNVRCDMKLLFIGVDENEFANFDKQKEKSEMLSQYKNIKNIKDKKILLFVGRIGEEKNVGFLLESMKRIISTRNDVHLFLVGGGSHTDDFIDMSNSLGLKEYTTFVGSIPHEDIRKYYSLADIFTFPSITEAQGVVTIEALYLGIPTVAVAALGTKTLMENNKGGFLVDEDISLFAEKINLLLDDKTLYAQKQKEALIQGKKFSFSTTGEGLLETYNDVIAKHKLKNVEIEPIFASETSQSK